MSALLHQLAQAAGLVLDWEDIHGQPRRVEDGAVRAILAGLNLPCADDTDCRDSLESLGRRSPAPLVVVQAGAPFRLDTRARRGRLSLETGTSVDLDFETDGEVATLSGVTELGYHRLELPERALTIAVCPPTAITPLRKLGRRAWGLVAQIYSLRGPGQAGDFGDLADLASRAGAAGADALAISPIHALYAADPGRYAPYSPSSRDHLNPLLASGAAGDPKDPIGELIDWRAASEEKLATLRRVAGQALRSPEFDTFVAAGGRELRRHALFEALHGYFRATQKIDDWRRWPAPFGNPQTAERTSQARALETSVELHLAFQWLAERDLSAAQTSAKAAGMGIGLVTDLAVGLDPAGSHAWRRPQDLLTGLTLGAPPDAFQADGQGWGITSFAPEALTRQGYEPFLTTLRVALRHAGGVRIDHALGLKRIWVIPEGASPLDGAYLRYPFEDLLSLIALESNRADAVVIGEDLGVVPPGLRETLAEHGVLGMRVLPFERTAAGGYRPPQAWDPSAVAMSSTHDLAPIAGWWTERDIAWRTQLNASGDRSAEAAERRADRKELWSMAGGDQTEPSADNPDAAVDAAIDVVAATPCELALIPMEDLLGLAEPVNLPGVVEGHPNWRRRLPLTAAELFELPKVQHRIARLVTERPK